MRHALLVACVLSALAGCVAVPATGGPTGSTRPGPRATSRPPTLPVPPLAGTPAPTVFTPLTPAAALIGKLKAGPASLIANNGATLIEDRGGGVVSNNGGALVANNGGGLAGAFRLLGLGEAPLAGAQVRLVDAEGQPLTDEVATTDAAGGFTLQRPEGLTAGLVQATFTADAKPIEYLAAVPASGAVEVDTATTLAAARWRLALRADRQAPAPGLGVLGRLRALLEPGRVPFMGRGSRDVADAFDQLVADDAELGAATAREAAALRAPARTWQVGPWHTQASLRALGALPAEGELARGEASVFAVDGEGQAHMVVTDTKRPRIIRLTADQRVETLASVPADACGPYSITFSPGKRLYLVHATDVGGLAVNRLEGDQLVRIFATPPDSLDIPDRAQGRLAASDTGEVYFSSARHHAIVIARPGQQRLERFAGRLRESGHRDGPRLETLFNAPRALAMAPDGRLYVADRDNQCIRRVEADGTVITVAGRPGERASRFGRGAFSRIGEPGAIAVAPDGTMYATDIQGKRALVLRLSPDGSVFFVAGGPERGLVDGPGPEARFNRPANLELDSAGNLYLEDIASYDGARATFVLRKLTAPRP
jgi:hypothetical protein